MTSAFELADDTLFAKVRYYGPYDPNVTTWQPQPSTNGFNYRFWFIGGWSNYTAPEETFLEFAHTFCNNWFGPEGVVWRNRIRTGKISSTFSFKEQEHATTFRRFWPMILKEAQNA